MTQRYKNDSFEIFKEGNVLVIKDLSTKRIVQAPLSAGKNLPFTETSPIVSKPVFTVYLLLSISLIVSSTALGIWGAYQVDLSQLRWHNFAILIGYASCQIAIHEAGHYAVFRMMGRSPDKVGFKLNYGVFPAFYVRMNDSHLLVRTDRYVVHSIGIVTNAIITVIAFGMLWADLLERDWLFVFSWYAIAMAYNCIPILNSDGFKSLLVLVNQREAKSFKDNSLLVRAIIIISYGAAVIYTARIIWLICDTLTEAHI